MRRWLAALAALFSTVALSQGFPERPVKIVVPLTPGGSPDTIARAISAGLQWPQPIVVENRPGGSQNIGADLVAKSAPARFPNLGDTPTIGESVAGYALDPWLGLFVPAKTPAEIVKRIHADVVKVVNAPDLKSKLAAQGIMIETNSPAEFMRAIKEDNLRWGKVI